MPCGGKKRCLKCKVKVTGALLPMSAHETSLLSDEEIQNNIRYACMTEAVGDICLYLDTHTDDGVTVLTEWKLPMFEVDRWGGDYGIAVDIGTTTIAAYLYRLSDGELISSVSDQNPQALYGADIISRIERAIKGDGDLLSQTIQTALSRLFLELVSCARLTPDAIDSIVLVGNTAMLYLLCGKNPVSIAYAPFKSETYFGESLPAKALNFSLGAEVYLPSCISAYIGADMTSALLAAGFYDVDGIIEQRSVLLADIGTNGEIALLHDGKLLCCSTAAGPAFEGAGIFQGMAEKKGAIGRVRLIGGKFYCTVLGETEAKGICGSGLLDAVASMLDAGILDETGNINPDGHNYTSFISEVEGQPAFTLPGTSIIITQKDIRALQLAKAAICAGIMTLLDEAGISAERLSHLLIAGGFGSHINPYSAERIGLIPKGYADKTSFIGNAAGAGASMILLNRRYRMASELIRDIADHIDLSCHPAFTEHFVEQMVFPEN